MGWHVLIAAAIAKGVYATQESLNESEDPMDFAKNSLANTLPGVEGYLARRYLKGESNDEALRKMSQTEMKVGLVALDAWTGVPVFSAFSPMTDSLHENGTVTKESATNSGASLALNMATWGMSNYAAGFSSSVTTNETAQIAVNATINAGARAGANAGVAYATGNDVKEAAIRGAGEGLVAGFSQSGVGGSQSNSIADASTQAPRGMVGGADKAGQQLGATDTTIASTPNQQATTPTGYGELPAYLKYSTASAGDGFTYIPTAEEAAEINASLGVGDEIVESPSAKILEARYIEQPKVQIDGSKLANGSGDLTSYDGTADASGGNNPYARPEVESVSGPKSSNYYMYQTPTDTMDGLPKLTAKDTTAVADSKTPSEPNWLERNKKGVGFTLDATGQIVGGTFDMIAAKEQADADEAYYKSLAKEQKMRAQHAAVQNEIAKFDKAKVFKENMGRARTAFAANGIMLEGDRVISAPSMWETSQEVEKAWEFEKMDYNTRMAQAVYNLNANRYLRRAKDSRRAGNLKIANSALKTGFAVGKSAFQTFV